MLFAPKAGAELRNQLGESAGRLRTTAGDTYAQASDKVSHMMDRGREAYDRARGTLGRSGDAGTMDKTTSPSMSGAGYSTDRS
jgi:hypothetical protein